MKKTIFALTCALAILTGCNKANNDNIKPDDQDKPEVEVKFSEAILGSWVNIDDPTEGFIIEAEKMYKGEVIDNIIYKYTTSTLDKADNEKKEVIYVKNSVSFIIAPDINGKISITGLNNGEIVETIQCKKQDITLATPEDVTALQNALIEYVIGSWEITDLKDRAGNPIVPKKSEAVIIGEDQIVFGEINKANNKLYVNNTYPFDNNDGIILTYSDQEQTFMIKKDKNDNASNKLMLLIHLSTQKIYFGTLVKCENQLTPMYPA